MSKVMQLMKQGEKVTIFCPADSALHKLSNVDMKLLLGNHIALKHGSNGVLFKSLAGGKISLTPAGNNPRKVEWLANGVEVLSSLSDGVDHDILITDDVIPTTEKGMEHFLRDVDNVSIFYKMLQKSSFTKMIKDLVVKKVCFSKDICLQVTPSMQEHLKEVINFKQFTILVPTDSMFDAMPKQQVIQLLNDDRKRDEFIKEHIFVGEIGTRTKGANKAIGYSVSANHSVLTMSVDEKQKMLVDANDRLFQVLSSLPVSEGLVHIVKHMDSMTKE